MEENIIKDKNKKEVRVLHNNYAGYLYGIFYDEKMYIIKDAKVIIGAAKVDMRDFVISYLNKKVLPNAGIHDIYFFDRIKWAFFDDKESTILRIRVVVKCSDSDKFDVNTGIAIANNRIEAKIARDVKRRMREGYYKFNKLAMAIKF